MSGGLRSEYVCVCVCVCRITCAACVISSTIGVWIAASLN